MICGALSAEKLCVDSLDVNLCAKLQYFRPKSKLFGKKVCYLTFVDDIKRGERCVIDKICKMFAKILGGARFFRNFAAKLTQVTPFYHFVMPKSNPKHPKNHILTKPVWLFLSLAIAIIVIARGVVAECQARSEQDLPATSQTTIGESWNQEAQETATLPTEVEAPPTKAGKSASTQADAQKGKRKGGQPKLLEMPATKQGEVVVSHTGYTLSYNNKTNCPNWVAWELTSAEASATGPRSDDFQPDPKIEWRSQVTTADYRGSGYDRGHMCPAADMKWSPTAQRECFYMSNMCPQLHDLNAGCWETLESACRRWAKSEGSVYIVCGPVFREGRKVVTIGQEHTVRVPDGFFKVVLSLRKGKEKAIGFYYAHNDSRQTMEEAAMTVDEVEAMTHYDFFYQIDKNLEKRIEASYNLRDWR